MCGRFTLRTPAETIADMFSEIEFPEIPSNYNVAPTHTVATIRGGAGAPAFAWLRWGLVPFWADDAKIGNRMINARSETVREKPAFRAAFKKRRCLVLADGFYEWKKLDDKKQPIYIHLADDRPFGFAGLWESNDKSGEALETCTIITTDANDFMARIHDRMPVILDEQYHEAWLDPAFEDLNFLEKALKPFDSGKLEAWPVSPQMNKPSYNQPDCVTAITVQQGLDF